MKSNFKKYLIIFGIALTVLLVIVLLFIIPKKKLQLESYEKYSLTVNINLHKNDNSKKTKIITVNYDGKNSNISLVPDALLYNGYLVGNTIYYEKDNKSSKLTVLHKYTDLYDVFENLKGADKKSKTDNVGEYYVLLKPEDINKILDCIYLEGQTSKNAQGIMTVANKKIKSFNFKFGGIDGYDEIELNFNFNDLKENYTVSIPKEIMDKSSESKENPYSIIKWE